LDALLHLFEEGSRLADSLIVGAFPHQQLLEKLEVHRHVGERIVELVSDAGRQRPKGTHPLRDFELGPKSM
jgi:hypothetical protein